VRHEFGTTILLTSHYMWEMETLSDRIAVLIDGGIRHLDTPVGLRKAAVGSHVVEIMLGDEADDAVVSGTLSRYGSVVARTEGGRRLLQVHTSHPHDLVATLDADRPAGIDRHVVRDSQLEDAYLLMVEGV
jgi:ABC-2 type transport system ATP-binding protein